MGNIIKILNTIKLNTLDFTHLGIWSYHFCTLIHILMTCKNERRKILYSTAIKHVTFCTITGTVQNMMYFLNVF